jgi:hypothetical protein
MLGEAGVTAMELRVGATALTVREAEPEMPVRVAVTLVDPAATPLATPDEFTIATAVLAADHETAEVMSAVEPSS